MISISGWKTQLHHSKLKIPTNTTSVPGIMKEKQFLDSQNV